MKKNNNKKGFTIVELVIVIAVIAILAAVLIPTFSNIIKKAQKSADTQLIRNLNNALAIDLAEKEENQHETCYAAMQAVDEAGYNVAKIVSKSGYNIAWNKESGKFVLLDEQNDHVFYPVNESTNLEYDLTDEKEKADFFVVRYNVSGENYTAPANYSCYAGNTFNAKIVTLNGVGFDAGEQDIEKVIYNNSIKNKEVIIRTNGGELVVDAPSDTIYHYGTISNLEILKVNTASYHEEGKVEGNIFIEYGHIELGKNAKINTIIVTGDNVSIDCPEDVKIVVLTDKASSVEINDSNVSEAKDNVSFTTVTSVQLELAKTFAGLGTTESPFLLQTVEDYEYLAEITKGTEAINLSEVKFEQTQNIEISSNDFELNPTNPISINMNGKQLSVKNNEAVNVEKVTVTGKDSAIIIDENIGNEEQQSHTHVFASTWSKDETMHWHQCTCGAKAYAEGHIWDDGVVTAATCVTEGNKKFTCTVEGCAQVKNVVIEKNPNNHSVTLTKVDAKAATCVATGNNAYWECASCSAKYTDESGENGTTLAAVTIDIDKTAHSWDTEWTTDTAATTTFVGSKSHHCLNTGCEAKNDVTEIPMISTNVEVSTASDLQNALNNTANNGKTIKLMVNITSGALTFIQNITVTLDLNGYTLTIDPNDTNKRAFMQTSGNLTLKNSGTSGKLIFKRAQRGFLFGDGPSGNTITNTELTTTFEGINIENQTSSYTISGWQWTGSIIYVKDCNITSSGGGINISSGCCFIDSTTITTSGSWGNGIRSAKTEGKYGIVYVDLYTTDESKATSVTCSASNACALINDNGTMYVYNGNFKHSDSTKAVLSSNNNNMYIYGGTFTGHVTGGGKINVYNNLLNGKEFKSNTTQQTVTNIYYPEIE